MLRSGREYWWCHIVTCPSVLWQVVFLSVATHRLVPNAACWAVPYTSLARSTTLGTQLGSRVASSPTGDRSLSGSPVASDPDSRQHRRPWIRRNCYYDIMSIPLRTLPIVEQWDCHSCAQCCHTTTIFLTDDDLRKLEKQQWQDHPEMRHVRTVTSRHFWGEEKYWPRSGAAVACSLRRPAAAGSTSCMEPRRNRLCASSSPYRLCRWMLCLGHVAAELPVGGG